MRLLSTSNPGENQKKPKKTKRERCKQSKTSEKTKKNTKKKHILWRMQVEMGMGSSLKYFVFLFFFVFLMCFALSVSLMLFFCCFFWFSPRGDQAPGPGTKPMRSPSLAPALAQPRPQHALLGRCDLTPS